LKCIDQAAFFDIKLFKKGNPLSTM